jgi:hypothetical protein
LEGLRQKNHAAKVVAAMEPTNYFWMLDKYRGVCTMKGMHFKSEVAQLELSDLQRTLSAL